MSIVPVSPDWRKWPTGLRVRHVRSKRCATYLRPSKIRHDGARVRWDAHGIFPANEAYVISPALDLEPIRVKAWDLIGFDSSAETIYEDLRPLIGEHTVEIRVAGGRARYEAVMYNDETSRSNNVKLARLASADAGLHQVSRYVAPDTELEIIAI